MQQPPTPRITAKACRSWDGDLTVGRMKMRELERRTGVNRETIRVFLRHGLIPEPTRPKSNVADYSEVHVQAIQAVRGLQHNSSMTLRQIREAMNGEQGGRPVDATAFQHLEALVATRIGIDVQPILLASLAKAFPLAESDARLLAKIGVIDILETSEGASLSITDARLVTIWSEMRQAGFDEEHGFTPDLLTYYIEPAHMVADNEARLFMERVEGRISEERAAAMLQTGLRQMQDFWGLIRIKRLLANIHREPQGAPAAKPKRPRAQRSPKPKPDAGKANMRAKKAQ